MSTSSTFLPSFLELKETEEYGRGVYSVKELSPGTDVIVGDPLAHVISSHEREMYCHHCLKKERSLKKCGQCKFVWYCSRACQREDWLYHKVECAGISRISPSIPTDTVRLIVRLLVRRSNGTSTVTSLPKGAQWDMDILTTHAPRYNEELKQSIGEQVFGAKLLMSDSKEYNPEVAFSIACKMISNSFSILDWEMNSIGSGVYILPALLNHSCDPNVIALFEGPKMRLRTTKKIFENEQLFVSYTDLLETRERRQRHLQKYYLFSCNCPRCSSEFSGSLDEKLIKTAADLKESDRKTLYKDGFSKLDEAENVKKKGDILF
uniref:MYND-type domain-containing protein n=1 Tax=Amphimedon queenslandica TaxID=400682 RepID=A0A1X7U1G6_AMPQE